LITLFLDDPIINGLRQKKLCLLPLKAEFTPFNLSALRETPKRPGCPREGREPQAERPARVEAFA
jgi:hypothetical protein